MWWWGGGRTCDLTVYLYTYRRFVSDSENLKVHMHKLPLYPTFFFLLPFVRYLGRRWVALFNTERSTTRGAASLCILLQLVVQQFPYCALSHLCLDSRLLFLFFSFQRRNI